MIALCIYELLLIYYVNLNNLKEFFSQNQCFKPVFAYIQLKLNYLDILFNQRYLAFEALMSSPNQVLLFPTWECYLQGFVWFLLFCIFRGLWSYGGCGLVNVCRFPACWFKLYWENRSVECHDSELEGKLNFHNEGVQHCSITNASV